MDICLLWAHAPHNGGAPSWLAPEDVRRFQELTEDHPVLIGRRTWEATPRALLAGRQSFVLSRRTTSILGAVACTSLDEAFTLAAVLRPARLFVLGGPTVHEQLLRVADRVYVARLAPDVEAVCAPLAHLDPHLFELVNEAHADRVGPGRVLQEYRRRRLH